jgi:hypothetical protein
MKPFVLPGDPAHARAVVREVLSRPEFAGAQPNASAWEKLSSWLDSLLTRVENAMHALPSWMTWVVVLWMTLTLLAIFGHAVYTLVGIGRGGRWRSERSVGSARLGELFGVRDLDFDSIYREALAALDGRDFARAVRYGYAAAILWLDRVSWLSFAAPKTNRDYASELRDHPTGASIFVRMTDAFEEVAYGARAATEDTARRLLTDLDTLRHESAQRLPT